MVILRHDGEPSLLIAVWNQSTSRGKLGHSVYVPAAGRRATDRGQVVHRSEALAAAASPSRRRAMARAAVMMGGRRRLLASKSRIDGGYGIVPPPAIAGLAGATWRPRERLWYRAGKAARSARIVGSEFSVGGRGSPRMSPHLGPGRGPRVRRGSPAPPPRCGVTTRRRREEGSQQGIRAGALSRLPATTG
jgi:hypothetical protein